MNIRADLITPEMVQAAMAFIGALIVMNFGAAAGAVSSAFKRLAKMKSDVDAAHRKIRVIEKQLGIEPEGE